MKFRIRFADQIVGFFIILALASLVFVIIMLGRSQRWFARDTVFNTEFYSANGLSKNMPVLYKGFTIGNVQSFGLNDADNVKVSFLIYEQYRDRVKLGSTVELMVSPVGLGNQFLFHPGKGDEMVEDEGFIPNIDSSLARYYIREGLADNYRQDDNISVIIGNVGSIIAQLEDALRTGSDATVIGQIIGGVNRTLADVETLPDTINKTMIELLADIDDVKVMLDTTLASINPILADVGTITSMLADQDGVVSAVLDTQGEVYTSLVSSLNSVSGILDELDKTAAFIPRQLPQIAGLIADLRVTLRTAEDVLTGLSNNPLLRGGIPEHIEIQSTGTSPRDIRF